MIKTMICVSIGRTRHKMTVLEHRALAEQGAELVELRIDWLSGKVDLGRLLKERPTPVIVTCRRFNDRGRWKGTEDVRLKLLREAIVMGVEYIDLEDDIIDSIPRFGETKRIVSYHNFDETPEDLKAIHASLCEKDADVVKIVTMAHSPSDAIRMLQLVQSASVPTVGFCMGELGAFSRILCGKYGAPFTYSTFSSERELAPGQLSFADMKNLYHYDKIDSETKVFAVLGDPIAHSLSPLIHNTAFADSNFKAVYVPVRVQKDLLFETLDSLESLDFQGYSVTIPHKSAICRKYKQQNSSVKEIGASNTIYRDSSQKWSLANTDYDAALESILFGMKEGGITPTTIEGKQILILGAGGVARAIASGLVTKGGNVTIANRTHQNAVELAEELGCHHQQWENRGTTHFDILVNCTRVGMHPDVDESPFPSNLFREKMLVFDTVYNPENTLFLKEARERRCHTVSGIEMFIRQAAAQFQLFTDQPAPLEVMRESLRKGISAIS